MSAAPDRIYRIFSWVDFAILATGGTECTKQRFIVHVSVRDFLCAFLWPHEVSDKECAQIPISWTIELILLRIASPCGFLRSRRISGMMVWRKVMKSDTKGTPLHGS